MKKRKMHAARVQAIKEFDKAYKSAYYRARRRDLEISKKSRKELKELTVQQIRKETNKLNKAYREAIVKKDIPVDSGIREPRIWSQDEWKKMTRKDQQFIHNFFQAAQNILNMSGISQEEKMVFADMMNFLMNLSWAQKQKLFDDILKMADQTFRVNIFKSERADGDNASEGGTGWLGENVMRTFEKYGFKRKSQDYYNQIDSNFVNRTVDKMYDYRQDYITKNQIKRMAEKEGIDTTNATAMRMFSLNFYSSETGGRWVE